MFHSIRRTSITVSILYIITSCLIFGPCQGTVPSPRATTDIICHTNHASECYPRIFQPTLKFQVVQNDQELPPGLHIRMNLATGVKEARLNEPEPEEDEHTTGLTVVDDVDNDNDDKDNDYQEHQRSPALRDQSNPPPPPPHFALPPTRPPPLDHSEASLFKSSIIDLLDYSSSSASGKDSESAALSALSDLEDLAHSHHWGLTLARDRSILHLLFTFLRPSIFSQSSASSGVEVQLRSATALLLATAIHNNPAALTAALSHFYNDEWPTGPLELVLTALVHDQLPSLLTRMVFLLSALCQDETQLWKFVEAGGLDILAKLFDPDNTGSDEKDRLRGKIANFMLDHLFQIPERHCLFERSAADRSGAEESAAASSAAEDNKPLNPGLLDCVNEDSWVLIDNKIISSMQAQGTTTTDDDDDSAFQKKGEEEASSQSHHHPVVDVFSPWCSLFSKSSQALNGRAGKKGTTTLELETATASENILDAQRSLRRKMNLYGREC